MAANPNNIIAAVLGLILALAITWGIYPTFRTLMDTGIGNTFTSTILTVGAVIVFVAICTIIPYMLATSDDTQLT